MLLVSGARFGGSCSVHFNPPPSPPPPPLLPSRPLGLSGNLMLVYGSGDDNCHYQNCELLVNELIRLDKHFRLMVYPNRTHAIANSEGPNTRVHLFETITRMLDEHLLK